MEEAETPVKINQRRDDVLIATIDCGNTHAKIRTVLMEDMKKRSPCEEEDGGGEIRVVATSSLLREKTLESADLIVLCSVVPSITADVMEYAKSRGIRVICEPTLETSARIGLSVRYSRPSRLGKDRLAAAIYAYHLCKCKSEIDAVVVVDAGTAVNIEVVTEDGGYLGGAILPGLRLMGSSLQRGTAQLSISSTDLPELAIGTSTESCLQSGIVLGFLGAVERVVKRVVHELAVSKERDKKRKTIVLSAGGDGKFVCDNLACIDAFRPSLVLDGIDRAYNASIAGS